MLSSLRVQLFSFSHLLALLCCEPGLVIVVPFYLPRDFGSVVSVLFASLPAGMQQEQQFALQTVFISNYSAHRAPPVLFSVILTIVNLNCHCLGLNNMSSVEHEVNATETSNMPMEPSKRHMTYRKLTN